MHHPWSKYFLVIQHNCLIKMLQICHATLIASSEEIFKNFMEEYQEHSLARLKHLVTANILYVLLISLSLIGSGLRNYSLFNENAPAVSLPSQEIVPLYKTTKVEFFFDHDVEDSEALHSNTRSLYSSFDREFCSKESMFPSIKNTCAAQAQDASTDFFDNDQNKLPMMPTNEKEKRALHQRVDQFRAHTDRIIEQSLKKNPPISSTPKHVFGPWRFCQGIQEIAWIVREIQQKIDSKYGKDVVRISPQCAWNAELDKWLPMTTYNMGDPSLGTTETLYEQARAEATQMVNEAMFSRFPGFIRID